MIISVISVIRINVMCDFGIWVIWVFDWGGGCGELIE